MKFKHLLAGLVTTLSLGTAFAGVSIGIQTNKDIKVANAYDKDTTYYYLTGKFGGIDHWTDYIAAPSDGNNAAVLLNQSLTAGDTFKFKQSGSWNNALTFDSFYSSAGAYYAFYWNNGDDNVRCGATGVYNFYIWSDSGTLKISAEFADSNTATYSYVLTSDSGYTNSYMYSGSNKIRDWGDSPSVNGQAYDVKLSYSSFDYYGLYRLDDRILNGWTNIILKNSSGQSTDISRTSGNKQEVYLCGASVVTKASSTDEYKAVAFLYDLVSHRGSAKYDNFTFAYSICATSAADASALVERYDGFSSSIKTILASSSCRTYDLSGDYGEDTKTFVATPNIVDSLRIVASRSGSGSLAKLIATTSGMNVPMIIIIVSSIVAVLGLGGFFYIRKRKHNI